VEVLVMGKAIHLVVCVSIGLSGRFASAETRQVPEQLRPWASWVLDGDASKAARCPSPVGKNEPLCAWPSRLLLDLDDRGGTFRQEWQVFHPGLVALPGNDERWPLEVRLDGKLAPVVDHSGEPQVGVPVGRHVLSGRFRWDALPEAVRAPSESGLVELHLRGKRVDFVVRDDEGRVFLGRRADEKTEADTVEVSVHRKLADEIPLQLLTRLALAVSGKSRELVLGRALPDGFAPVAVESPLPLRFETDGRVRLQARPGTWAIAISAQRVSAERSITRPQPQGLWKEGDEAWVFEARPQLRDAVVEGVPAIDPEQTNLPSEWRSLPAYALAVGATLSLVERRRGNAEPPPDRLTINRVLWLDSGGGGYSVNDTIAGEFNRAWRLEMGQGTTLGRVAVAGQDQFITRDSPGGRDGVELRKGQASIDADSRIEGRTFTVPATSFAHDFDSMSAIVKIPPGWRLFHASGSDGIAGTWFDAWFLTDLILWLVVALGVGRLYGFHMGALALLALGITVVEPGAPRILWLAVLVLETAVRKASEKWTLLVLRVARAGAWLGMAVVLLPFAMGEASQALFPAMDRWSPRFAQDSGLLRSTFDTLAQTRFVNFLVKPPESPQEEAGWLKKEGGGRRHKGEEGKMGLYALKGPKDNPSAHLARKLAEANSKNAGVLGSLIGSEIDEAYGVGGLGLVGTGAGGGGTGEGTIGLGNFGTIGKGGGTPPPPRAQQYDPSVVVQTGHGLPRWSGTSAALTLSGPVAQGQELRFYLAPPWLNRILATLRIVLVALLAWLLLRRPLRLRGTPLGRKPLVAHQRVGLASLLMLAPLSSWAGEIPPKEMLDELKDRLVQKPECAPDCASINEMIVQAAPAELHIRLHASAAASTAIPLPGHLSHWSPTVLHVDGKPAKAISRNDSGHLLLWLEPGVHTVDLQGPLPGRPTIQVALPMRPRHASASVRGFRLDGIHEDGAVDESLLLSREQNTKASRDSETGTPNLPPFLHVERTLVLGLKWEVRTKVTRISATGTPIVTEIPLLPGESVTTSGIRVEKTRGVACLSFAPGDDSVVWESTLAESDTIHLRADPSTASRWSESWLAQIGTTWHAVFSGIPPVRSAPASLERIPEWRPWPGEEVHIALNQPKGVPGQTLTVDNSSLTVLPDKRGSRISLLLELRSSRNTRHTIALPPGAVAESVALDGMPQPLRLHDRELSLTVPPGRHTFDIAWREPTGLSALLRTPEVDLRLPSANASATVRLESATRWLLWLSGPGVGPAAYFWLEVGFLLVAAWLLARIRLTPLRMHHWALLGLGLLQLGALQIVVVPACLLALGWRAKWSKPPRASLYDASQVVLLLLFAAALAALYSAVEGGLLRLPDMQVAGNNSTAELLTWYQDRAGAVLPRAWIVSLPIWVYRGAMLAWSVWLVFSAVRWSPWLWARCKEHGLWQPVAKPLPLPPGQEP
jgi:hypothetical protein